jgi:hypothetical protein
MDWNRIEGNWKELKGKLKEQWGHPRMLISTKSRANATSWKAKSSAAESQPI